MRTNDQQYDDETCSSCDDSRSSSHNEMCRISDGAKNMTLLSFGVDPSALWAARLRDRNNIAILRRNTLSTSEVEW